MMLIAMVTFCNLLVVLAVSFTPYVTRKTELFGVSMPSSQNGLPELRKMRRSFLCWSLIFGAVMSFLSVAAIQFLSEFWSMVVYTSLIFVYLFAYFFLYLFYHKKMKLFKSNQDWSSSEASLVVDINPGKDTFSPAWLLTYPVIAAATIFATYLIWPLVPDKIPMNYDMAGNAVSWAQKNWKTALFMLVFQWFTMLVFAVAYIVPRIAKRQIDAANPETSRKQGKQFRRVMSGSLVFGGMVMGIFFGACQIMMLLAVNGTVAVWACLGLMFLVFLLMGFMMFKVGQGGSRVKASASSDHPGGNIDDDKYWKLGMFYYNKNDPAVFVEKRFGIGYTNNWARPLSWILLIGLLVVTAGIVFVTFLLN